MCLHAKLTYFVVSSIKLCKQAYVSKPFTTSSAHQPLIIEELHFFPRLIKMVIPHLKRSTQILETGGLIDALIRLTLLSQLPGLSIQSLLTRPGLSEIRMPLLLTHPLSMTDSMFSSLSSNSRTGTLSSLAASPLSPFSSIM